MGILSASGAWHVGGRRPFNSSIGRRIALAVPCFFLLMPALSLPERVGWHTEGGSELGHDVTVAGDAAGRWRDGVLDRLEPCEGDTSQYDSTDVPKSIPDIGSVESTLAIPDAGATDDIDVRLDVSHPFDSDLLIELVPPAGKSVTLADSVGMWGDDFTGTIFDDEAQDSVISVLPPFGGRLRPSDPLSDLDVTDRAGTWVLRVTDQRGDYTGSITGWGLDITKCSATASSIGQASSLAAVDQLPPRCGDVGAPKVPKLPPAVPSGEEEIRGTLITVTSDSDATDGDVSSVEALLANPGADGGISLREAIEATNNDPGEYTIRFAPQLAGATIGVGSANLGDLPPLTGGGVFVNGDITGDGRPDVTLQNTVPPTPNSFRFGVTISSSGNRVHALAVEGFSVAGLLQIRPPSTDRTFANNTVTGLVLDSAIVQFSGDDSTGNRWIDTRIIGNTIRSENGIIFNLHFSSGDVVERVSITNNTIRLVGESATGIGFGAGFGGDSKDNIVSDALVAYNSINGKPEVAIVANAGALGASSNTVEDIRIIGNRVRFPGGLFRTAISIFVGDAQNDVFEPQPGPTIYPDDNVARRIEISGNRLEGQDGAGVELVASCCGGANNRIEDVRIEKNVIHGVVPGLPLIESGVSIVSGESGRTARQTADNEVSGVTIHANTITQRTKGKKTAHLFSGGITVVGGEGARAGRVRDVRITNNRVVTSLVGINLVGGGGIYDHTARGNTLADVEVRCNEVVRAPVLITRWEPRVRGINLTGGLGAFLGSGLKWMATANEVTCVRLRDNLVVGVLNDISVIDNVGKGASRNVATRGGC